MKERENLKELILKRKEFIKRKAKTHRESIDYLKKICYNEKAKNKGCVFYVISYNLVIIYKSIRYMYCLGIILFHIKKYS